MAYNCYIACDKCGDGYYWTNNTVSYNRAISIARDKGWTVGKRGWYCPQCKRKKTERGDRDG